MTLRRFPGPFALQARPLQRVAWLAGRVALALLLMALATALAGCSRAGSDQPTLLVFAASDLRDALTEIARDYRLAGGDSAVLVFGSTGDLATQIASGAPADIFFSASAEAIDQLVAAGHVSDSSRAIYALGRLAILARCTRADTLQVNASAPAAPSQPGVCPRLTLPELANDSVRTIAIADPSHAPYGRAAKQVLERSGLWNVVQARLVLGANISQAELFVTSGNADAGIIALSLLQGSAARTYTMIDSALHDPLVQTAAVTSRSTRTASANAFLAHVRSATGRAVMRRYGFALPASDALPASGH